MQLGRNSPQSGVLQVVVPHLAAVHRENIQRKLYEASYGTLRVVKNSQYHCELACSCNCRWVPRYVLQIVNCLNVKCFANVVTLKRFEALVCSQCVKFGASPVSCAEDLELPIDTCACACIQKPLADNTDLRRVNTGLREVAQNALELLIRSADVSSSRPITLVQQTSAHGLQLSARVFLILFSMRRVQVYTP